MKTKEKGTLKDEISSLKKVISAYKVERKADWKSFKTKMKNDIDTIEKSISKVDKGNKK